jgi:hypothetical protein
MDARSLVGSDQGTGTNRRQDQPHQREEYEAKSPAHGFILRLAAAPHKPRNAV